MNQPEKECGMSRWQDQYTLQEDETCQELAWPMKMMMIIIINMQTVLQCIHHSFKSLTLKHADIRPLPSNGSIRQ